MSNSLTPKTVIDALEKGLIGGRAKWIADFDEFFRYFQLNGMNFDLYARGRTRNRGFFLSKFFAWTALPDYSVALFCTDESGRSPTVDLLRSAIETVLRHVSRKGLHWAWLIVVTDKGLSAQSLSFVSRYDRMEIGLVLASTSSRQFVWSKNLVGRSSGKHLGLTKILKGP